MICTASPPSNMPADWNAATARRPRRARRRRPQPAAHRADRREGHALHARLCRAGDLARRRRPGARRRLDRAGAGRAGSLARSRGARTRSRPCGWPGISATATPMCRSSATRSASAPIMCWKTCCAASARMCRRSTRRSIRSRPARMAIMAMSITGTIMARSWMKAARLSLRRPREGGERAVSAGERASAHDSDTGSPPSRRRAGTNGVVSLAPVRPLSPDGLAVAGVSGRRLLLFERHRMGGRDRRHRRRSNACKPG